MLVSRSGSRSADYTVEIAKIIGGRQAVTGELLRRAGITVIRMP